jgi:uncharacterized membrane-anchored protein
MKIMQINFSFKEKIVILIVFQLIIIFGLILINLSAVSSGNEVFLEIESLEKNYSFSQNYLDIEYDISSLSDAYDTEFKRDEVVYVILEKNSQNNYYGFKSVQKDKPLSGVFIKGKVAYSNYCSEYLKYYYYEECTLEVTYGIESFFVPNTTPYVVDGNKYAKVMIDQDGRAILRGIYIDSKKI